MFKLQTELGTAHSSETGVAQPVVSGPSAAARLACGLVYTAAVVVCSVACIRLATLPTPEFVANVIVDDAYYYLQPARNLLNGRGYSFDGEKRTNGVQPLWAGVAVGVAALVADPIAAGRSLVLIGGACWIFAGIVLYRVLARWSPAAAVLAGVTWLMTALVNRLGFQGMENGLHALLLMAIVAVLVDRLTRGSTDRAGRFWLVLGLLLGLITLTRVDSALLALLVGAAVLLGLIRADGSSRLGLRIGPALVLALPGVLLVGGLVLFNELYFGSSMPVSGRVKLMLEEKWAASADSTLKLLENHARLLYGLSSHAVTAHVDRAAWTWFSVGGLEQRIGRGFAITVAVGLVLLLIGGRRLVAALPPALRWSLGAVTAFVILRSMIYALQLPHFTPYCTWYFGPDLMLLISMYAIAVVAVLRTVALTRSSGEGRLASPAAVLLAAPLVLAGADQALRPPAADIRTSAFLSASQWMDGRLPAGSRIGAFSAGIVAWHAPQHQVINLDGLMNDKQYMLEYLKPDRVHQYVHDRDIEFIADYQPVKNWATRAMWGVQLNEFDLVRWWRLPDEQAYAVWRRRAVAGDAWRDQLSSLQFEAETNPAFRVVPNTELASALAAPNSAGLRVCGAVVAGPCEVRHILLTDEQYTALQLDPLRIDIDRRIDVQFGDALRLVGVTLHSPRVRPGQCVVLTRVWQCVAAPTGLSGSRFETWISPAFPEQREQTPEGQHMIHSTTGALGSRDLSLWQPGEVVIETVCVPVPPAMPAGAYPLRVGIWDPAKGWLQRRDGNEAGPAHLAHVANVTVAP